MLRSPVNVSMINHLATWTTRWEGNKSRDGILRLWNKDLKKNFPFFIKDEINDYLNCNKYEKALMIILFYIDNNLKIKKLEKKYGSKVIIIPFENLITDPVFYLDSISKSLSVKRDLVTKKVLEKNLVPRKFDIESHDQEGFKFLKNRVRKKYFNKIISLNKFYHNQIIKKY